MSESDHTPVDLVILGAGGFAREIAWLVQRINAVCPRFRLRGFCDDAPSLQKGEMDGLPLFGRVENLRIPAMLFCAIGSNPSRKKAIGRILDCGLRLSPPLVDPSATVAPGVRIGEGSVVGIGSILSVGSRIGRGVILNHKVCVGHDVEISDFAQVCPGASISGGCRIGEGALLGTQSGVIPLKRIGAGATVGAGVVAIRDLDDGQSLVRLR